MIKFNAMSIPFPIPFCTIVAFAHIFMQYLVFPSSHPTAHSLIIPITTQTNPPNKFVGAQLKDRRFVRPGLYNYWSIFPPKINFLLYFPWKCGVHNRARFASQDGAVHNGKGICIIEMLASLLLPRVYHASHVVCPDPYFCCHFQAIGFLRPFPTSITPANRVFVPFPFFCLFSLVFQKNSNFTQLPWPLFWTPCLKTFMLPIDDELISPQGGLVFRQTFMVCFAPIPVDQEFKNIIWTNSAVFSLSLSSSLSRILNNLLFWSVIAICDIFYMSISYQKPPCTHLVPVEVYSESAQILHDFWNTRRFIRALSFVRVLLFGGL